MNVIQNRKTKINSRKLNVTNRLNFRVNDENNPERIINQKIQNQINQDDHGQDSTATTSIINNSNTSQAILALTEGRLNAKGEVGMACIDLNCPILILSQISDDLQYSELLIKMNIMNPVRILMPDTIFETLPVSKIVEKIRDHFPHTQLVPVQRKYFHDKDGLEKIKNLACPMSSNLIPIISKKYYCLSAAAALLEYLKKIQVVEYSPNCLKIEFQPKSYGILIDINTSVRLELLYSLSNELTAIKKFSLFNLLNFCITRIGERHLRANILEPSCDVNFIIARQEQIKVLMENEQVLLEIRDKLGVFKSVDQTLKISCITPTDDCNKAIETNINLAILLKKCLEGIKPLSEALQKTVSITFEFSNQILSMPIYQEMIKFIDEVLEPEIHKTGITQKHFQLLYALKSGYNEEIDILRVSHQEFWNRIQQCLHDLSQEHKLSLKLIHSDKYGHHLTLKNPHNIDLPDEFIVLSKKGQNQYLTTSNLISLNDKIRVLTFDLVHKSNAIISNTLIGISNKIDIVHQLISVIIELDIVQSLTQASTRQNYCCPTFGKILKIKSAFHPMLEITKQKQDVVTNNVMATPQYNFFLMNGPNMSGKTIYIKMIAIIQIMSQIGCFVPATAAEIRIVDRIFSRIGFQDNLEQHASSFTVELREMEYIYSNLTPNSLVIMDELCRSSNPRDGEAICAKFCEKLLNFIGVSNNQYFVTFRDDSGNHNNSTNSINLNSLRHSKITEIARPFIFLTTHFTSLYKLESKYKNFMNLHMVAVEKIIDDKTRLEFTYKVKQGISEIKNYGLAIARCLRFPEPLIDRADQLVGEIEDFTMIFNETMASKSNKTINSLNNSRKSANISNTTSLAVSEMQEYSREIYELFSEIVLLMNDPNRKEDKTKMMNLNQKIKNLYNKISDEFKQFLQNSELGEIISEMSTQSSE